MNELKNFHKNQKLYQILLIFKLIASQKKTLISSGSLDQLKFQEFLTMIKNKWYSEQLREIQGSKY